jgi:hypothetical protein
VAQIDLSRARWRKSRRSAQGQDCVEVAGLPDSVAVRDSKNPGGPALVFPRSAWRLFVDQVRADTL